MTDGRVRGPAQHRDSSRALARTHKVSQSISVLLARNHIGLRVRHGVVEMPVYCSGVDRVWGGCDGTRRIPGVMVIYKGGK